MLMPYILYVCIHMCIFVCMCDNSDNTTEMQPYIDISLYIYHDTLGGDTVSIHI